jgi:NRAMP (natural resistance-associated macrophage protein)-like metal ion transporter
MYWTMLAASTVGPGTIIVMAKSGADYHLHLLWAVLVASVAAYTLQEGAARLYIVSGLDFGQAIRFYFSPSGETPWACRILAVSIILANTALEAGQIVGAMSAVYIYHDNEAVFRVFMCFGFGAIVASILLLGNVETISKALGGVVVLMVATFGIGAAQIFDAHKDGKEIIKDLFVPQIPNGGSDIALSMIATTALPFNVFLASSLAEGFGIRPMRQGIAFSTFMAGILSILIVIVGTGAEIRSGESFGVADLSDTLRKRVGNSAVGLFTFGLFAASFSSALTVALGE